MRRFFILLVLVALGLSACATDPSLRGGGNNSPSVTTAPQPTTAASSGSAPANIVELADQIDAAMAAVKSFQQVIEVVTVNDGKRFQSKTTVQVDRSDSSAIKAYSVTDMGDGNSAQAITIGDDAYVKNPGENWQKTELPEENKANLTPDFTKSLRQASSLEAAGAETIDGVAVTKYLATGQDEVVEIYVDAGHRLIRRVVRPAQEVSGDEGGMTVTFGAFDEQFQIDAPI